MIQTIPLRGLPQVNIFAEDVAVARDWCSQVLGSEAEFLIVSVIDPFGNILGLIQSPHYVETFDNLLPSESSE